MHALVRACSWVADFSPCPHTMEEARKLPRVSVLKALIFIRALPPNNLQKAPPSNSVAWGVGIPVCEFGEHTAFSVLHHV